MNQSTEVTDTSFFGHPKGLMILFMTEMWERFSYYGMRALLIFYLTQHFLFGRDKAYLIYGAYTALVYVAPVIGGLLADKYLGSRKAVVFGAILLVAGHLGMAVEGDQAQSFVDTNNKSYEIVFEGRGDDAEEFLVVDGKKLTYERNSENWLEVKNSNALPSKIEDGDFEIKSSSFLGLPFFKKTHEFVYQEETLPLTMSDDGKSASFNFKGSDVDVDIKSDVFLEVENASQHGLRNKISYADYKIRAVQNSTILNIFYLSLALIIAGVGFLKANISTIVGALYEKGDKRRDAGFTLFYMGINLGAAGGAILAGWLGQTYGWAYGFGLAGLGMLAGLVVFLKGQPLLQGRADPPSMQTLMEKSAIGISREWTIYLGTILGVIVIWKLIQYQELVGTLLGIFGLLVVIGILVFSFTKCSKEERDQMIMALMLMIFSILFWALFEQAGSSLNIYTDEAVDRTIFGWDVPASVFQSINAIYIVIFGPIFAALWLYLGKRDKEPSIPAKFGLGLILLGLGFLVLVWGANGVGAAVKTPVIFIFLIYLLHTFGELCMSPVGLSAVTKLSVPRVVGLMMGTWFLASATGNFAASMIARLTSGGEGGVSDPSKVLEVYSQVGLLSIIAGIVIIILTPLVFKKLMHGVR